MRENRDESANYQTEWRQISSLRLIHKLRQSGAYREADLDIKII